MVDRLLMGRFVVGLMLHGGPIELFSFHPVLYDWYNKGRGIGCRCRMVHIHEPLLLIEKSSPYSGGSGFSLPNTH